MSLNPLSRAAASFQSLEQSQSASPSQSSSTTSSSSTGGCSAAEVVLKAISDAPSYWSNAIKEAPGYWGGVAIVAIKEAPGYWGGKICTLAAECYAAANSPSAQALRQRISQNVADSMRNLEAQQRESYEFRRNNYERRSENARVELQQRYNQMYYGRRF